MRPAGASKFPAPIARAQGPAEQRGRQGAQEGVAQSPLRSAPGAPECSGTWRRAALCPPRFALQRQSWAPVEQHFVRPERESPTTSSSGGSPPRPTAHKEGCASYRHALASSDRDLRELVVAGLHCRDKRKQDGRAAGARVETDMQQDAARPCAHWSAPCSTRAS